MTSMRMRLVSSVSFVALLLKRCRLLCEALVAASCCFTFETSTMQKPRVFEAFQTKTSQLTPTIIKKQDEKHGICDNVAKTYPKKQDKKLHTKKNRNILLFSENHTNTYVFKLFTKKTIQK